MKITDSQRIDRLERQLAALITLVKMKGCNKPEPQLKQLDQSVFNGLDEKWRFAAVDSNGDAVKYTLRVEPYIKVGQFVLNDNLATEFSHELIGENYDASNWKNSLIERDIARELLEIDLSSELTGSDLAKDYFKRGCCPRVCFVGEDDDECLSDLVVAMVIGYVEGKGFETSYNDFFPCAAMVNSYGDELTASEVGL